MGVRIKCPKCGLLDRYETSEIHNQGTAFVARFTVSCHNCNFRITQEHKPQKQPLYLHNRKTENEISNEISIALSKKRLYECFLQEYLREEYRHYGFLGIEGPFPKGPDFKVLMGDTYKWLEVETVPSNYKKHNHHLSKDFNKAELLFYFFEIAEKGNLKEILPQGQIKTDTIHFKEWYKKKIELHQYAFNVIKRCDIVYNEYVRIFFNEVCYKKEGEMAICPNCITCTYFDEEWVMGCTNKFLTANSEILNSEDYDFRKLTYKNLHKVFGEDSLTME